MQNPPKKLIRLVYENGVFRPTEPIDYPNGVEVMVEAPTLTTRERARLLLGDLLEDLPEDDQPDIGTESLLTQLRESVRGVNLSGAVLEERQEGW